MLCSLPAVEITSTSATHTLTVVYGLLARQTQRIVCVATLSETQRIVCVATLSETQRIVCVATLSVYGYVHFTGVLCYSYPTFVLCLRFLPFCGPSWYSKVSGSWWPRSGARNPGMPCRSSRVSVVGMHLASSYLDFYCNANLFDPDPWQTSFFQVFSVPIST